MLLRAQAPPTFSLLSAQFDINPLIGPKLNAILDGRKEKADEQEQAQRGRAEVSATWPFGGELGSGNTVFPSTRYMPGIRSMGGDLLSVI